MVATSTLRLAFVLSAVLAMPVAMPALAQTTPPRTPGAEVVPAPPRPCSPDGSAHATLSDQLSDCSGVLRPSTGMDPEIRVPTPPATSDMPVIRPETGHVDPK